VNELRTELRGQLVVSDDPEARTEPREVWNAMHVDRPAITARCAGTADVVDAVNFARERGLLVAGRWCPIAHSRQLSCSRTPQQRCLRAAEQLCCGVRELEGTDCHVWTTSGQPEFPIGGHNARSIR
jgi:hypothetical protein